MTKLSAAPLILGVDTSGHSGSIALARGEQLLEEMSLATTGRRHARTLVSEIRSLLQRQGCQPRDCELVAVSQGPGSFTGLRVGVVFAKAFAYATECPVVAVDTFAALAMNAPPSTPEVWVVDDAQRGSLFVGQYRFSAESFPQRVRPIEILDEAIWAAGLPDRATVLGPGVKRISPHHRERLNCLGEEAAVPRGGQIVRLGWQEYQSGQVQDPFQLVPFYLRRSAAEETAERKRAAADPVP